MTDDQDSLLWDHAESSDFCRADSAASRGRLLAAARTAIAPEFRETVRRARQVARTHYTARQMGRAGMFTPEDLRRAIRAGPQSARTALPPTLRRMPQ
jgi:hypothetical protein